MKLRHKKVLSLEEALALNAAGRRVALKMGYLLPLAGAEGEEEEHEEEEHEEEEEENTPPSGEEEEEEEETDRASISMAEYNRLKRVAAEAEKARKAAEREAKKRKEREQREAGDWQELIDERDERIKELEAERDEAKFELDAKIRSDRVTAAALRLNFKDPRDAIRFLSQDETEDDAQAERALKRLAKEKAYLIDARRSSGVPVNGEGGGTGLTLEEIKRMTPEQVNERWEEVQQTLGTVGTAR